MRLQQWEQEQQREQEQQEEREQEQDAAAGAAVAAGAAGVGCSSRSSSRSLARVSGGSRVARGERAGARRCSASSIRSAGSPLPRAQPADTPCEQVGRPGGKGFVLSQQR